jgi:hypothetical protein
LIVRNEHNRHQPYKYSPELFGLARIINWAGNLTYSS